jgi:hypothetical protein
MRQLGNWLKAIKAMWNSQELIASLLILKQTSIPLKAGWFIGLVTTRYVPFHKSSILILSYRSAAIRQEVSPSIFFQGL